MKKGLVHAPLYIGRLMMRGKVCNYIQRSKDDARPRSMENVLKRPVSLFLGTTSYSLERRQTKLVHRLNSAPRV